jgi:hypothetical protein
MSGREWLSSLGNVDADLALYGTFVREFRPRGYWTWVPLAAKNKDNADLGEHGRPPRAQPPLRAISRVGNAGQAARSCIRGVRSVERAGPAINPYYPKAPAGPGHGTPWVEHQPVVAATYQVDC